MVKCIVNANRFGTNRFNRNSCMAKGMAEL